MEYQKAIAILKDLTKIELDIDSLSDVTESKDDMTIKDSEGKEWKVEAFWMQCGQ